MSFSKYPFARIQVTDNGPGFSEETAARLNRGEKIIREDGSHIGIRNVTQRLRFLYGEDAAWDFHNDGGAVCVFSIPARFEDEIEDKTESVFD